MTFQKGSQDRRLPQLQGLLGSLLSEAFGAIDEQSSLACFSSGHGISYLSANYRTTFRVVFR